MTCCRCNRTGTCKNCSCVKYGLPCHNCSCVKDGLPCHNCSCVKDGLPCHNYLPGRMEKCQNGGGSVPVSGITDQTKSMSTTDNHQVPIMNMPVPPANVDSLIDACCMVPIQPCYSRVAMHSGTSTRPASFIQTHLSCCHRNGDSYFYMGNP